MIPGDLYKGFVNLFPTEAPVDECAENAADYTSALSFYLLMITPVLVIMESEEKTINLSYVIGITRQDALILTSEYCILIFELTEFPVKYFEFSWGNVMQLQDLISRSS